MQTTKQTTDEAATPQLQIATFGAGCFWGVEEAFRQVPGVETTAVGYSGGSYQNPTYRDVCSGRTGHAEVVQVTFDPAETTYEELLQVFWGSHNPRTRNWQGWDIGAQYRSAIFFHTPEQEQIARRSREEQNGGRRFWRPIVTEITPASTFYRAEEYHQAYLAKRGIGACKV
jgi:peptide-methionine (S)-S-oxide reductase